MTICWEVKARDNAVEVDITTEQGWTEFVFLSNDVDTLISFYLI